MKNVLLVEDDKSLGATLADRLSKEGLRVEWVTEIKKARIALQQQDFDLVILDVGLPDGNGFELARELKGELKSSSGVPFIFVTSQSAAEDRLMGYELGADEFIPKPFHLKELLMRVQHVLYNHSGLSELRVADVVVNFTAMQIHRGANCESLNLRESQTLKLLVKESPRVLSRDEILDRIWGQSEFPTNRTVDNLIVRLRQVLGADASAYLRSVRGVGYQWVKHG